MFPIIRKLIMMVWKGNQTIFVIVKMVYLVFLVRREWREHMEQWDIKEILDHEETMVTEDLEDY